MKSYLPLATTALTACVLFSATLQAQPVTDWHTFRATTATTLSGQGTASPVFGSTSQTASTGFLVGYLSAPLSLANVGDKITLTFDVSFNDAVGMANGGDNFRFALFDLNGQMPVAAENSATAGVDGQTDNWRGYWFGVRNGSGTGSGGSIRERIAPLAAGDNIFAAAGDNAATVPSLGAVGGTSVSFLSLINGVGPAPTYSGEMTLTRTEAGIDLTGFFSGSNGGENVFSVSDNSTPFPSAFGAVAFFNGSGISADEVRLENVQVSFIPVPEPSSIALVSLGLLGLGFHARRRAGQ